MATETEIAIWEHVKDSLGLVGMRRADDGVLLFGYSKGVCVWPSIPAQMAHGIATHVCDKDDAKYVNATHLFEASVQAKEGVNYDPDADVLYVRRIGVSIHRSKEAEHDGYLILNMDSQGEVVGAQLLSARQMPASFWATHPDRGAMPSDILGAIDTWIDTRPTPI